MTVAALYIDPRGPYPTLPDVECWDESRDARLYDGPWPVVAHPPCGPWGKLRHMYKGAEHDCAFRAVEQVRKFGGILEHPAGSRLWREMLAFDRYEALPVLDGYPDPWGGYTIGLNQCDWGHPARKATWLYCVGVPRELLETPEPREPTHWISGGRGRVGKKAKTTPVPPGIKVCSAQQRRRTPIEFARYLVRLAESSRKTRAA